MSGTDFSKFSPEALAFHASIHPHSRFATNRKSPRIVGKPVKPFAEPKRLTCQNRAAKDIDQGDTIAELRKAWGIGDRR